VAEPGARETTVRHESLALCLRDVLAAYGRTCTYEQIVAALGLGFATAAAPGEPVGQWPTFGRDAALRPAAELLGLRLRELHPPEAARGLHRAGEFAGHFADSYVPLIRTALAHGQTVLAWRGWPPPAEGMWGLLREDAEGQLVGWVATSPADAGRGRPGCTPDAEVGRYGGETRSAAALPLAGPAHQVYVIEEVSAVAEPSASAALDEWAGVTLNLWSDRHAVTGVHFGPAAYRAWLDVLAEPAVPGFDPCAAIHEHAHVVSVLAAARAALATWLGEIRPRLDARRRDIAGAVIAACEELAARAGQLLREELAGPRDWEQARDALRGAIQDVVSTEDAVICRLPDGRM
jgi:hypothetical protein